MVKVRVLVGRLKEPLEQPDHPRDGVEGKDDLLVVRRDAPQPEVGLLKVLLIELVRLLKPDPRDPLYRFDLLGIVQASAVYLRAV